LLELQADGTLPEFIQIEVKNSDEEESFFRFIVSRRMALSLGIEGNRIPFDEVACDILDQLPEMCGFCFLDRRKALEDTR
jgi:hypothetical protein